MRVLFYIKNLNGGGAERAVSDLVNALDRTRFEPKLLLGSMEGEYLDSVAPADMVWTPDNEPEFGELGFRDRVRGAVWARWLHRRMSEASGTDRDRRKLQGLMVSSKVRKLRAAIESFRPDVIVSSLFESASVHVYLLKRTAVGLPDFRWIAVEQNNTLQRYNAWYDAEDARFWGDLTALAYRDAEAVVAVSNGVRQGLAEHYGLPRDRITVIPNHVAVDAVEGAARAPVDPPFILAAGRLHHQKNFEALIRAYARIASQVAEDLVIVGEGGDRDRLVRQARELGVGQRVRLPGFADDLWSRMKAASCLVLSSRFEGLPLTVLEAMAAGCPVVAFDCDYGPREIISDRVDGLLVPDGDVPALAAAMRRVLSEPELADRLRENGPLKARRFDLQTATARYEDLLTKLAG